MNICITSQGDTLEAPVDPRFGRCRYFMFLDTATDASTAMENPYKDGGGAGIQVGQVMAQKKVNVVLTGNIGPNAFRTLQAAGIQVITGVSGTVQQVIEQYKKGAYPNATDGPTVDSHAGMQ